MRDNFRTMALLAALVLLVTGCGYRTPINTDDGCDLRVAWDPYEPYSYASDSGQATGYDIEVVTEVTGMLGCSLSFRQMEWSEILLALKNGDVDVTVGTGYKPDRAEWSWYTESYRKEVVGLMIRAGTTDRFPGETLDAVLEAGLVFGKTIDDTYDASSEASFARFGEQVRPRVSEAENVQRLLDGSIDGFLVEINVGAAIAANLGAASAVEFHPLQLNAGNYRLQLSKQTVPAERVAALNEAIQALADSGWLSSKLSNYALASGEAER